MEKVHDLECQSFDVVIDPETSTRAMLKCMLCEMFEDNAQIARAFMGSYTPEYLYTFVRLMFAKPRDVSYGGRPWSEGVICHLLTKEVVTLTTKNGVIRLEHPRYINRGDDWVLFESEVDRITGISWQQHASR